MPSDDNIINEYKRLIVRIIFVEWIRECFGAGNQVSRYVITNVEYQWSDKESRSLLPRSTTPVES